MDDLQLALLIQMGLKALNYRILTLVSIMCSMGLFAWAMIDPKWERIVAATLGGIVFWCLVNLKGKGDETRLHETAEPDAVPVRAGFAAGDGEQ